MSLLYCSKTDFLCIHLADDGQGMLFHPHRNHLAALHLGKIYYQVTPEFYAFLRLDRETLRERVVAKTLDLERFNELDKRFLQIRKHAIETHGELTIKSAVLAFLPSSFTFPQSVYRPTKEEVLPLSWSPTVEICLAQEGSPQGPIRDTPPSASAAISSFTSKQSEVPAAEPSEIPQQEGAERLELPTLDQLPEHLRTQKEPAPQTLLVKHNGAWVRDAPLPNEPLRTHNLTAGQLQRQKEQQQKNPDALSLCHAVVKRTVAEIARIYFACDGFETPYAWLHFYAIELKAPKAIELLETLRKLENILEENAANALVEQTENSAVFYLAHWRKIIFLYDDWVTEERKKNRDQQQLTSKAAE